MRKIISGFAVAIIAVGLLSLSSQAKAEQFVLVADTSVCGSGTGLNALAVIGELQKKYAIKGSTLIIAGLHGGAGGTVSDDGYDVKFYQNIQKALSQLKGVQLTPLMVSAGTINKSFTEAVGHYDVILLAWCHSDAWYEKTGKGLAVHNPLTKVTFSTAN